MFMLKQNYQQKFDEKLEEQIFDTYKFSNHDNNQFIFLLQKSVCHHEYMDNYKKFNETSLPENEDFYCHLIMEDITNVDYALPKRVFKGFEVKYLLEYHDLHVQSYTLLLADVFENFDNMCQEIYNLDLAKILSAPGLAWQTVL